MLRRATVDDVERITRIYNEAIVEGGYTGDLVPLSIEDRLAWYDQHQDNYAVLVEEIDGDVVGYVALSPYRKGRQAFSGTCEISYYLLSGYRGRGAGQRLIKNAMAYAADAGFDLIVAIVLGSNGRSIDILKRFGFVESGRLPKAARVGGERIDHVYLSCCPVAAA